MSVVTVNSTTATAKLELGRECPPPDEDKIFAEMARITLAQMESIGERMRRGQHAEATGYATRGLQLVRMRVQL